MYSNCAVELCAAEYGISVLCRCIVMCSLVRLKLCTEGFGEVKYSEGTVEF